MITFSPADCRAFIKELDPNLHFATAEYKAMLILLAITQVEHTEEAVCAYTGLSSKRNIVGPYLKNLEENGIIRDGKVFTNWGDTEEGVVSFCLDALVATGKVKRVGGN